MKEFDEFDEFIGMNDNNSNSNNNDDDFGGGGNDGFIINFDEVEADTTNVFDPVPKGTYDAVIISVDDKNSSAGNAMLVFNFKLTSGGPGIEDHIITKYAVLSGNGSEYGRKFVKKLLVRLFKDEIDLTRFNKTNFANSDIAVGKQCSLVLSEPKSNGSYSERNNILDVKLPNGSDMLNGF